MDIKKEAGVVYEYFEKYNLGNSEGAFTEEWKILYAADSYKIISEFYDMFRKISKLSFTFVDEETDEEVVYYKVMDDDLLRKTVNGEQVEVDNEDIKEYEELVNSLSDEKLYPSRRYIQELKKQKKHLEILFMVIDILSVALPIFIDEGKIIKGIKTGKMTADGKEVANAAKKRMNDMTWKKAFFLRACEVMNREINVSISNFVSSNFLSGKLTKDILNVIKDSKSLEDIFLKLVALANESKNNLTEEFKEILSKINKGEFFSLLFSDMSAITYTIIKKIYYELSEAKLLTENEKSIKEEAKQVLDMIENTLSYSSLFKMDEEDFGVSVFLKKDDNLVYTLSLHDALPI